MKELRSFFTQPALTHTSFSVMTVHVYKVLHSVHAFCAQPSVRLHDRSDIANEVSSQ